MVVKSLAERIYAKWRATGLKETLKTGMRIVSSRLKIVIARVRIGKRTEIQGVELDLSNVQMDSAMQSNLYYGQYEQAERDAIKSHIKPDMDVVDLGACIGFTACTTNSILSESSTHIAVEPNPQVIPTLKTNRDLNNCNFDIIEAAYSTGSNTISINPTETAWSASLYRDGNNTIESETVSLKQISDQYDISNAAIIVDIEGGEADLIENELEILEEKYNLLIIEFHDEKSSINQNQREQIRNARFQLKPSKFNQIEKIENVVVFTQ